MTITKKTKTGKCFTVVWWNKKHKRSTSDFATRGAAERLIEKLEKQAGDSWLGIKLIEFTWDDNENDYIAEKEYPSGIGFRNF